VFTEAYLPVRKDALILKVDPECVNLRTECDSAQIAIRRIEKELDILTKLNTDTPFRLQSAAIENERTETDDPNCAKHMTDFDPLTRTNDLTESDDDK
jgi:hypothetical protein